MSSEGPGLVNRVFDPEFGLAYDQLLPSNDILDRVRKAYQLDIASQFIAPLPLVVIFGV